MGCARAIVQAGLVRVVTIQPDADFLSRWREEMVRAMKLFQECGVELVVLDAPTPAE